MADAAARELVRPGDADEFNTKYMLFELEVRLALASRSSAPWLVPRFQRIGMTM
jgi:hypothetical protein